MKLLNFLIVCSSALNSRQLFNRRLFGKKAAAPVVKFTGDFSPELLELKNFMKSGPYKAQFNLEFRGKYANAADWNDKQL